jgi:hypothetical protein
VNLKFLLLNTNNVKKTLNAFFSKSLFPN